MDLNNAVAGALRVSCGMQTSLSAKMRMDILREELRSRRRDTDESLLAKLERCGVDWQDGRYRCRSPACIRCRHINIRKQQRDTVDYLGHFSNEDLAFVTVVLPGTTDITHVGKLIAKSRRDTANRFKAARRTDDRWHGTYLRGWHEIDAVGPDQFAILPPQRRALIPNIAPASTDGVSPTWIPSFHAVMFKSGLTDGEITDQLRRQWKHQFQVDVRPFDHTKPLVENLHNQTSYANKFHCATSLEGNHKEQWPISWQAEMFGYLASKDRSPFERLRITINQFEPVKIISDLAWNHVPMPMVTSFTSVPMLYNTGRYL